MLAVGPPRMRVGLVAQVPHGSIDRLVRAEIDDRRKADDLGRARRPAVNSSASPPR